MEEETREVVVNACYGGFSLSEAAITAYRERAGMPPDQDLTDDAIDRNDPDLIAVVKELGEKANGPCASLEIIKIPRGIDWYVDEHDGREWIAEVHRTWRPTPVWRIRK